ncbi:hypothetical protein EIMP300_58740 [Escherichia coli]|uniref:Uncharacterized protein n=1 Tax=Escherichia coli TaxID=562 RepID=A0A8S0FUX2_ECOLX|nr:hypothetical protein EIMP300_58740 [Escherichia coli]
MFVLILELARIRNAKGVGSTPLSKDTAGRILHEAGMLKKSTGQRGGMADTYATAETPQACTSLGLYAVVYSGI